jgi:putative transposase
MVTPVAERQAVAHLCSQYEVSQWRACSGIGADRTSVRYRSRRSDYGAIRVRWRELATTPRRFGYRRLLLKIRGEGLKINHKKQRRLYAEAWLTQESTGNKDTDEVAARSSNQRWSLDFVIFAPDPRLRSLRHFKSYSALKILFSSEPSSDLLDHFASIRIVF